MSENWDDDIAALLDDVLQDKEPVVQAKAPPKPEPLSSPQPTQQVSGNTTLADLLSDDEPHQLAPESIEAIAKVTGATPEQVQEGWDKAEELTTVVNEDVHAAALPPIDMSKFSTPVEGKAAPMPSFTNDELMAEIDIRNFGTLVSLTNRRWHAKIKDRKAAKDAAEATGADAAAFEARKRLLVGADEKLKAVHACIDAARTEHYAMTLPWSTVGINDIGKRSGPRLLPNKMLFEYSKRMGQHKAAMIEALDKFVAAYPTLLAIAQQKLGAAFNQSDYPPPSAIAQYFALEFDFEPIPSGGDFQGLQDAQVEKLAASLARKTRARLENAMQDAWQRLYEVVNRAVDSLTAPDATFHYTLVDKLRECAITVKHLNVINDSRIEEVRQRVENELTKFDAADVRKDDALRKRLGDAATSIKKLMEGHANES